MRETAQQFRVTEQRKLCGLFYVKLALIMAEIVKPAQGNYEKNVRLNHELKIRNLSCPVVPVFERTIFRNAARRKKVTNFSVEHLILFFPVSRVSPDLQNFF